MNVTISVDDYCSKFAENLSYLKALSVEFPVKFTLFAVPKYEGKESFLPPDGIRYEIACHGLTHKNGENFEEMRGISLEEFEEKIKESKRLLEKFYKCKVYGYKPPGWFVTPEQIHVLKDYFDWIQLNRPGCEIKKSEMWEVPVTYDLNDMGALIPENIFFQSHFSHYSDNSLNFGNYLKIRKGLKYLMMGNFCTITEAVNGIATKLQTTTK